MTISNTQIETVRKAKDWTDAVRLVRNQEPFAGLSLVGVRNAVLKIRNGGPLGDLASPTDAERLDWLSKRSEAIDITVGPDGAATVCRIRGSRPNYYGDTLRAAIDAAMKNEEKGK